MQSISTTNSRRILLILLLINFLSGTVLYAQTPVTSITDYVIWGSASAQVGYSSIQGGSIGSYTLVKSVGNMTAGTSTNKTNIYSGGTVVLANSNVVKGNMTAGIYPLPSVIPSGTIFSAGTSEAFTGNIDVYGDIVIGGGTVTGIVKTPKSYILGGLPQQVTGPPTLPILPQAMPIITAFPPAGATNVTSGPIGPGNYGNLTIGGNTTVTLNGPGIYVFKSITTTGPNSKLVFNFNSTTTGNFLIYVYGDVLLYRTGCSIINGGGANRIFTEVHGNGSTNTSDKTVAFSMSNGSNGNGNTSSWFGSVWVPYAAIKIGTPNGPSMAVQGALWSGTQVNIIDGVSIVYSACGSPAITTQPAPPTATCAGSGTQTLSVSATGTGLTYSWRKAGVAVANGGVISGQGTATLTLTNPIAADAGNYDVVVGGTCGTATSTAATVTVNALPTISGILNVCVGSTTTLTGSGTADAVTPWVSANTSVATISSTGVVTAVGTVGGTSVVTYKNNNGCAVTATVIVNALPTISGNLSVCVGSTTTLTGTGTADAVTPWVSANTSVATISSLGVVTAVVTVGGTSVVTYKNNNGCTATATVIVNALPTISGILNVCVGSTTTLTGSGTADAVTPWVSANTSVATISSSTGLVTAVGTVGGTSVVTYKNNNGCTATATVIVNTLPTISGNLSVCVGSTTTLTGTGTADAVTPWVSANTSVVTISSLGVVTAVGTVGGTSVITYKNNNGCTSTATVIVNALPTISGNLNVCVGSTTTLTGSGTADAVTPWVSANTSVATISSTGLVTAVGIVGGTSVVTYKNNDGCTITATVIVNPLPTVIDAAGPDKPYNFDGITTIGNPNLTGFTFKWTAPPGGLITTADDQASINVTAPGIYKLTFKSAIGCTSTDDVLVSNKVSTLIGSELTSIYWNNPTGLPSPFFIIKDGYVRIDIIVELNRYDYVLNLLTTDIVNYGLKNTVTNGVNGAEGSKLIITGDYPIANLLKLNDLYNYINFCRPFYVPFTNSGLVNSAGDTTMRSNLVRSGYKVTGAGVKVGVVSNSFNTITSGSTATLPLMPIITGNEIQTFNTNTAAIDLSNDDLPNVTVLPQGEYPGKNTDEGRAMLQIVHDVAPGAKLYFRTGFLTAGDFAIGIKALKDSGCNIIVDDVTYITEPYLKDGVVAKAVDEVKSQGVTYFSAAGNFSNKSYEKDFTPFNATTAGFPGKMAHDFSGTGDIFQHITMPPGDYTIVLQWVDNIYSTGLNLGTKYDLDMYWRTTNTDGTTALKGFNRDNTNGDPLEILPFTITTNTVADFVIVNSSPATTIGNPARIKYIIYRGNVQIGEYNVGNSTVVGQANAAGAIAVGAARYDKAPPYLTTPLIEPFSSYGGTVTEGTVRNKPDLVGPDGGNTTVKMGQDYPNSALDGYSNFFGTSAAAPHAAAAAALIMEGRKKFIPNTVTTSPDYIRSLLQTTAVDMVTPGFDFISGYGLVDNDSAMRTFAAPTATLINVVVPTSVVPCSGPSFTVTITGENFNYNTIVMLVNAPGDTTKIVPTYINSSAVSVTISSCAGNPKILAYTPPKTGTNGTDGGFSNSKYFFSAAITVTANNITKKYGETLTAPSAVIKVNGVLLQNTSPLLSLQDIGLDKLVLSTPATTGSDVGTYIIIPSRTFDPANTTDAALQKKYSYQFFNGAVSIAKMPLRVTPDNKTVTYGQSIGNITYTYNFDATNVPNLTQFTKDIKNYHDAFLPKNALAVVKDFKKPFNGSPLDTTSFRNMNMIASFNAVKNSRKFTLLNNTLVPVTDPNVLQNNLNIQYLVDLASESIYDYKSNPATAKLYPGYTGINPKALLSASSIESDDITKGTVTVNGTTAPLKILNGLLSQTISSSDGQIVPLVNGSLVQIVDAIEDGTKDTVQYLNDGSWIKLTNGGTTSLKILNSSLKILNTSLKILNGVGSVLLPDGITYAPIQVLVNGTALKVLNGTVLKILNGIDVPIPDGSYVQLENGGLVQVKDASFQVVANSVLKIVNGTVLKILNGTVLKILNGTVLKILNSSGLGTDVPSNNTAVILDSKDAINDGSGYSGLGAMFGINMITGLDVGKQYLVPGTLVNPNFDISYGLGEVDITKAQITLTAAANIKTYDGTTSAVALPIITTGTLASGDIAVFNETYDNKNQGSGKTMTPAVVSIVGALGVSAADNYNVTLISSTNGVINKLDITVTPAANAKTYDGTIIAAAMPTITTGSLASGDVAVFKETYDNKNQGSGKTMTPVIVSIVDALNASMTANYNVTLSSSTNGVINKQDITVTSAANTKTYNGTTVAAALPTVTAGTLVSGDIALFSEMYDNKNQGTGKTMTPAVISIVDASNISMAGNYNVTLNSSTNGVINKAPLTVTADDKTRKYGENNPVLTVSYGGLVNNEDSLSSGIKGMNGTGIPSATTTASQYSTVSPPTYPITAGIGTLASSSNYAYSFVNGALTITPNQCLITHDATNFVSTSNPGTATSLWLNITVKVSGQLATNGDYLIFRAGGITLNSITSNPIVTDLAIPNGKIIADNSVSSPKTNYDAATNTWITKVPLGYSSTSDIFVTGAIINSSNGFAAINNNANSVLKGMFYSNKSFSDQWAYAMGAYQPPFGYNAIAAPGAVASVNGTYRAGTPTTVTAYIVAGGTGNGKNNYTGSLSNQNAFTACIPSSSSAVNRVITSIPSLGAVRSITQEGLFSKEKMDVYPNPATNNVVLSFVPANTGISKIALLTIDGKRVMEINNGISEAGKKYIKNIDVSKLVRGVYMIQLNTGDKTTIKKVIITR